MPKLPDRWLNYSAIGNVVAGTNIIPFKVPLRAEHFRSGARQRSRHTTEDIARRIPRLGIVICLTNTPKYYQLDDWSRYGIEYKWIKTEGHVVPKNNLLKEFCQTVHDFTKRHPDKLVGVHCTHGLNRTGYFVCSYMVLCNRLPPLEAIENFGVARGHRIERQNYIDAIEAHSVDTNLEMFREFGRHSSHNTDLIRTKRYDWVSRNYPEAPQQSTRERPSGSRQVAQQHRDRPSGSRKVEKVFYPRQYGRLYRGNDD